MLPTTALLGVVISPTDHKFNQPAHYIHLTIASFVIRFFVNIAQMRQTLNPDSSFYYSSLFEYNLSLSDDQTLVFVEHPLHLPS